MDGYNLSDMPMGTVALLGHPDNGNYICATGETWPDGLPKWVRLTGNIGAVVDPEDFRAGWHLVMKPEFI